MHAVMFGYYVHHHGVGHRVRYERIVAASSARIVPISELDLDHDHHLDRRGLVLTSDVPDGDVVDPIAGGALHWAPIDVASAGPRARTIVTWLDDRRPSGVVVDVSCEMTLLCRLAGVPTVVVRQHGNRLDAAHELAYRSAAMLLAPWPEELEAPDIPTWLAHKTVYTGFVHAAPDRIADVEPEDTSGMTDTPDTSTGATPGDDGCEDDPGADDVVVLWGTGGGALGRGALAELAAAVRPRRVFCLGHFPDVAAPPEGVVMCGFTPHVDRYLRSRPTVVATAGNNAVADVARAGCALVVIPQQRPFDEQVVHARALERAGFAAVADGSFDRVAWRDAIDRARSCVPRFTAAVRSDGAARAAEAIAIAFGDRS